MSFTDRASGPRICQTKSQAEVFANMTPASKPPERRRSFATAELSHDKIKAIAGARMDPRHAHLNALLDPK